MRERFDHTADLGLRAQAATQELLFLEMAYALTESIVEPLETIQPRESRAIAIDGTDPEWLLMDWLRGLLGMFESERWLTRQIELHFTQDGLQAILWGEPMDPARHPLSHEVKAITYHGLICRPIDTGWLAEVIVDI